jgi:hypothetical protein
LVTHSLPSSTVHHHAASRRLGVRFATPPDAPGFARLASPAPGLRFVERLALLLSVQRVVGTLEEPLGLILTVPPGHAGRKRLTVRHHRSQTVQDSVLFARGAAREQEAELVASEAGQHVDLTQL